MYGILRVPYLISQPSPFPTTCPGGGSSLLWRSEMPLRWFGGCIGKRNRARPTSLVLPLFVSSVQPRAREAEEKRRRWLFSLSFVSMVAWAASQPPSLPPSYYSSSPSLPPLGQCCTRTWRRPSGPLPFCDGAGTEGGGGEKKENNLLPQ